MEVLILLIEDNDTIRENIEEILTLENFKVITANNGITGVALAKKYLPDLIICDILMSGLDGYEVLTQLKNDPQIPSIPVIFSTSKFENSDKERALALGVKRYLVKPFDLPTLMECINDCFP
ncbi:response regulator [Mucilaginibacter sp. UR6-11]|uniref:response regulator n=1 Tax=Mucilaginibacter sp. UR6-11 TaxID=1435644 RepID=UPI001E4F4297|nr:response regulator [Mucilaginibacter sp. UR6-11]MCC8426354.1 response regulator [Mucilaginibacter sp. UR6-11]